MMSSRLMPVRRRILELLASNRHGMKAELLIHGHGVSQRLLAELVRVGLAAAERETVEADGRAVEVVRIKITAAGRRAIEGQA